MNEMMRRVFKRLHFPAQMILTCVRWYVAYPLSLRHLQEMMAERGVEVDHSSIHRWAVKRVTRPKLGFKTFRCARIIIAGIETMHMIGKNQLGDTKDQAASAANQFYSLAS